MSHQTIVVSESLMDRKWECLSKEFIGCNFNIIRNQVKPTRYQHPIRHLVTPAHTQHTTHRLFTFRLICGVKDYSAASQDLCGALVAFYYHVRPMPFCYVSTAAVVVDDEVLVWRGKSEGGC